MSLCAQVHKTGPFFSNLRMTASSVIVALNVLNSFPCVAAESLDIAHLKTRAQGLADHFILKNRADKITWDWGPAFFLYGLSKFSATVSDEKRKNYTQYITNYHQAFNPETGTRKLPDVNWSDKCPSALSGLYLQIEHGNPVGMPAAKIVSDYLHNAPRNSIGALDHLGKFQKSRKFFPNSIWVDSLVMYGVFAAQWGKYTNDSALLDFAASQPLIFANVLQDSESHLFRHAYNTQKKTLIPKIPGGFWLRGNGWALASMLEILDALPENHQKRSELIALFQKSAEGALKYQKNSGLWSTIMNRPNYYEETSGSAILAFAFAKGVRLGLLDGKFKSASEKTLQGLDPYFKEIFSSGKSRESLGFSMSGISWWTVPGPDWLYRMMPRRKDMPYGIGAYLLAVTEAIKGAE